MLLGELPVPPPQFHDAHGQGQGQDPEDEDENMGDDLFGDDDDDDDEELRSPLAPFRACSLDSLTRILSLTALAQEGSPPLPRNSPTMA